MKTSLGHLPQDKRADVDRIVLLIRKFVSEAREKDPNLGGKTPRHPRNPRNSRHSARDGANANSGGGETSSNAPSGGGGSSSSSGGGGRIEKIILYGSHARGDWVFDNYTEDGITYEYVSDYDVLIVTDDSTLPMHEDIWERVRDRFAVGRPSRGPGSGGLSLIVHTMKEVSSAIEDRRYFFTDVLRDGVLLHEAAGSPPFAEPRELSPEERKQRAEEEFERWFGAAERSYVEFQFCLQQSGTNAEFLKNAAFQLHQTTENLYITASMVFTDYRPKLHDLYKLRKRVGEYDRRLMKGFAFHTPEQKRLFKLLADAYVHARYTKTYTATAEELEYLAGRVRRLQSIVEEVCREQIARLG